MSSENEVEPVRYPGQVDTPFPEVFNTMPKQPEQKKPGQLSEKMIKQFFEKGYVIVEDFFTREEMDPCRTAIEGLVEELAQKLFKAGKITDTYKDLGFFQRLTQLEKDFPGTNVLLHKLGKLPQAFRNLWSNERLLNVIEQLLGPDIAGHPVWNLRTKTPQNEATTVPWHQDCAYLDNESYEVLQPTAWIPLLDATEENGCMQVAVGGHRSGKIATHQCCYGGTWYVMLEEEEMVKSLGVDLKKDILTCPIPYGGFLLFNNAIPHRSLPNLSQDIRWSLDLRWQRPDKPVGFYGIKDSILMRSSADSDHVINWDPFDEVDRHEKAKAEAPKINPVAEEEEFDLTIQGPWMKKWAVVHMNQHTDRLLKAEEATSWHKA
ncbi:probable alpha-ketoglutarate-dependent hypophosphite dioxygenase isoform X2 [Haliotis rubra]|nr:probable alpha-ketoglutarate-dependent hypophosphite dioxygenase isoform X2 [Haliotis rubra]XP_046567730.1 probable alpha-ketoglutarate-dependent hypophosphite dioxygenase isoform X2 [Haliotis rubra]